METKTIAADFASEDIYNKIKTSLAGLKIGVLGLYLCHIYIFFLHLLFDFYYDYMFSFWRLGAQLIKLVSQKLSY